MKRFVVLIIISIFPGVNFAAEESSAVKQEKPISPEMKALWKKECAKEYEKDAGYRSHSSKEKDLSECKGKVGESFCVTEKEEDFLATCFAGKEQAAKNDK